MSIQKASKQHDAGEYLRPLLPDQRGHAFPFERQMCSLNILRRSLPMSLPPALSTPAKRTPSPADPDTRLRGRWLLIARSVWLFIAAGMLANVVVGTPAFYAQSQTICTTNLTQCSFNAVPTPDTVRALQQVGLTLDAYAVYLTFLAVAVALVYLAVGALIFWRKSQEWLGLFISFVLVMFGSLQFTNTLGFNWPPPHTPLIVNLFLQFMGLVQYPALAVFLLTFPTGRFAPRWSSLLVLLWIVQLAFFGLPAPYNIAFWPPLLIFGELLLVWGSTVAAQVYRYRRVYTLVQRQQTKWVVFGVAVGVVITVLTGLIGGVVPGLNAPDSPYQLLSSFFTEVLFVAIPLSIGIAILRYRLWDIDTIINKALVYGLLTALLGAVYAGLIIGLESLAGLITGQASTNPLVLVVSTLAITALLLPVRRRIQALIDRRFYRKKYDAQKTLAAFSETLQSEVDLEQICAQMIAVVQETMQPAHVSLWLRQPERHPRDLAYRPEPHDQGPTWPSPD